MEHKRRSILKALSWRVFAVLITGTIVWLLTGEPLFAVKVGMIDTAIKLLAYYFHERAWNRIQFGLGKAPEYEI